MTDNFYAALEKQDRLANYALAYWSDLRDYSETDETRQLLKVRCRLRKFAF